MRLLAQNPCCSSGCPASKVASILPSTKYVNVFYNNLTTAFGRKSDVDFAPLVEKNIHVRSNKLMTDHVLGGRVGHVNIMWPFWTQVQVTSLILLVVVSSHGD